MIQKLMNMFLVVFVFSAFNISAQTTTVTGTITDSSDGMELPSVTVQEKGTSNGTTSDFNGKYTIEISNKNATLQFSYLGYKTKEVTLNGEPLLNVILEQSVLKHWTK